MSTPTCIYPLATDLSLLLVCMLGCLLALTWWNTLRSASACVLAACLIGIFVPLFRLLTQYAGNDGFTDIICNILRALGFLLLLVGVYAGRQSQPQSGSPQQSLWTNWVSCLQARRGLVRIACASSIALFLLVFLWHLLATYVQPEYYASTARIRVNKDRPAAIGSEAAAGDPHGYDPHFLATELEVITSRLVLEKVIADLNLSQFWGESHNARQILRMPETIMLLRRCLEVRLVPNTSLLEIRVTRQGSKEAADLANAIAAAYQQFRVQRLQSARMGSLQALRERYQESQAVITKMAEKLASLIERSNIAPGEPLASRPQADAAKRSLDVLMESHDALIRRLSEVETAMALPSSNLVEIVEYAQPALKPIYPNKTVNIVVGLVYGIFFGLLVAGLVLLLGLRGLVKQAQPPALPIPAANSN